VALAVSWRECVLIADPVVSGADRLVSGWAVLAARQHQYHRQHN
jgi:hypothetical protein